MNLCHENCKKPRCAACFYARHQCELQESFPWLECRQDPFGVGCLACRQFFEKTGSKRSDVQGGLWSSCGITSHASLQRRSFEAHETTTGHEKAVAQMTQTVSDQFALTPTDEQFKRVYQHAIKHPLGDGISAVGGQKNAERCFGACRKPAGI